MGKIFHEGVNTQLQDWRHSWTPSTVTATGGIWDTSDTRYYARTSISHIVQFGPHLTHSSAPAPPPHAPRAMLCWVAMQMER